MEQRGEGWVLFAGIILFIGGILKIFDAIWAFSYHGVLPANLEGAIFGHNLKTWGWINIAVAAILILCSVAVMGRSNIGRWVGIFAAVIAAIDSIWWMPFYPIWALTYLLIAILVIYGLAVYGGNPQEPSTA
ncbi:MAG TPA: hypothetical protein VG032_04025 [Acidimicrobiales bacterium]|jgi:hypothetical protein|nr:hypothetical protein [Acidimicrobiales bacterium]